MLKKLSVLAGTAALAMSLMLLSGCGGDTVPTGGNGETTGSADGTTTTASLTGATDPADTTEEETTTTSGDSAIKQTGDNHSTWQTSRTLSQEIGKQIKQLSGDSSLRHNGSGKNKQRNRQNRCRINSYNHRLNNIHNVCR